MQTKEMLHLHQSAVLAARSAYSGGRFGSDIQPANDDWAPQRRIHDRNPTSVVVLDDYRDFCRSEDIADLISRIARA